MPGRNLKLVNEDRRGLAPVVQERGGPFTPPPRTNLNSSLPQKMIMEQERGQWPVKKQNRTREDFTPAPQANLMTNIKELLNLLTLGLLFNKPEPQMQPEPQRPPQQNIQGMMPPRKMVSFKVVGPASNNPEKEGVPAKTVIGNG